MAKAKDTRDEEVKAAEKPLDSAKETNPVGEATRKAENVDPYSAGETIANPEPNNGLGSDPETAKADSDETETKEAQEDQADQAETVQAQEERELDPAAAKDEADDGAATDTQEPATAASK